MLRLIVQKVSFILLVVTTIIFFVHMGMRMVHNSDTAEPNYDLVQFGQLAWGDTRAYLTNIMQGDLGEVRVNGTFQPLGEVLWQSCRYSMALLLISLALATGLLLQRAEIWYVARGGAAADVFGAVEGSSKFQVAGCK